MDAALLNRLGKRGVIGWMTFWLLMTTVAGCSLPHLSAIGIAIDPAGKSVAYLWEDRSEEPAVDGKVWSRTISLHWCAIESPSQQSSVAIDSLGLGFAGYAAVPADIKWSPSGTCIGVLTPQKLVLVDAKSKNVKMFEDGTITSFAWLSDDEVAYCTRRTGKGMQRRVICRQKIDHTHRSDAVEFDWYPANTYFWQEHWSPSGQYVVVMEPAIGGRFQMVDVLGTTSRPFGQTNAHDEAVAWSRDSRQAFCVSETVGPNDAYEALLISTGASILADCSKQYQESFATGKHWPRLEPFWTVDGAYVIGNDDRTGGYLIQPNPWRVVHLGQMLSSRPEVPKTSRSLPWLSWLPVPGWIGVLPTGNEGDSPIKYATTYSGQNLVPLIETRGIWAISSNGAAAATVDNEKRVRVRVPGKGLLPSTASDSPKPGALPDRDAN